MRIIGPVPQDAPDPRIEMRARLASMPSPAIGFVSQPTLEDSDMIGWSSGSEGTSSASISYTLWRNPDDHTDPANLAVLDEVARASLDEVPPWPRPPWILEFIERMRYPIIWEAVRTTWRAEVTKWTTPEALLLHHIHHIHLNRFAEELGWEVPARGFVDPLVTERSIRHAVDVQVDGDRVSGMEVDTDPFVYAAAAELPDGRVLTAVVPRDDLPWVRVEFAQR
jgi:hypothetical protein